MALVLNDPSPSAIVAELERLLSVEADFGEEFEKIEFGDWAAVRVYLPQPEVNSAITPPYMEAFLALQKQIYQLAALTESGVADSGQLTEAEKRELQLNVVVSGGSSNLESRLEKPLLALLKKMVGKLSGKQSAIVIVALAGMFGTYWCLSAWLDHTKQIKIEEIKSKDHVAALQALQFANKQESEAFRKVISILEQQGSVGKRAVDAIAQTNEALLKAASSTPKSTINQVEITKQEADILRISPRKKAEPKVVQQRIKVVDINTADPYDLQVVLVDPSRNAQYRIRLKDDLFAGDNRKALFAALESREMIWAELAMREIDGEVKSVQLQRIIEPPTGSIASDDTDN
jgi:hypothetical protein